MENLTQRALVAEQAKNYAVFQLCPPSFTHQKNGGQEKHFISLQGALLLLIPRLHILLLCQKSPFPLYILCFHPWCNSYLTFSLASDPENSFLNFLPFHCCLIYWFHPKLSNPSSSSWIDHFPISKYIVSFFPHTVPGASLYFHSWNQFFFPFLYHSSHWEKGQVLCKVCSQTGRDQKCANYVCDRKPIIWQHFGK